MAFFDANLMSLKLAQEQGLDTVNRIVRRLTSEPAQFFGLDVGTLSIGAQADITMINPDALKTWDTDSSRKLEYRELFEHNQMVNRSDDVVSQVLIRGESVWENNDFTEKLGAQPLGRVLRAA
jgi:N-acyl-D-aspartate/D-glutamate deacylase